MMSLIAITMEREDPTSTNGTPSKGELQLPMNAAHEECIPYIYQSRSLNERIASYIEMTTQEKMETAQVSVTMHQAASY